MGQGLSGGQKRRLCVALQMIILPSVLFLDEPTSGKGKVHTSNRVLHNIEVPNAVILLMYDLLGAVAQPLTTLMMQTIVSMKLKRFDLSLLGLDASSSLELLNHLNLVAESGRLVILTIHQPRLEIFHLFHKILLLCDGQVS